MAGFARLTRTVGFRALHRLALPGQSEEEARARFGWTAASPGHQHHYRVSVTVGGLVRAPAPMVVDLGLLDGILRREVVERYGGRLLNEVAPFDAVIPTCEALAIAIYERLGARLPEGVRLDRVRVAEDDSLEAEYAGD